MRLTVCFLLFSGAFYVGETINSLNNAIPKTSSPDASFGSGMEILLTKLNYIDRKLFELLQYRVQLESYRDSLEKMISDFLSGFHRFEDQVTRTLGGQMSVLQNQSLLILEQQKTCVSKDQLREELSKQSQRPTTTPETTTTMTTTTLNMKQPSFTSCRAVTSNVSGVYLIHVNETNSTIIAFCEQNKFGGGWLVVQHRFNGSVDFYRNWNQYRDGFGDLKGEFWFGLEKMHQITTARPHEMVIELKDFSGNYGYARYDSFKISNESEHYKLTLGKYSGTAGDGMVYDRDMKFSTKDNDMSDLRCVERYENAWWQGNCSKANLNGRYINATDMRAMHWWNFKQRQGLSFSRMMIRELA